MILHPLRRTAIRDLPERIARIQVDGGDPGPWRFDDRQSLDVWRHAGRADHLDVGLTRLWLFQPVDRGVGPRCGTDVQESGLGIKCTAFPVDTTRTGESESAFGAFRRIDD